MHTEITLNKKLTDAIWDASLAVMDGSEKKMSGEVLLAQVNDNSVKLVLDSSIKVSKIADREVISYTNAKAEIIEIIKPGTTFTAKNSVWPSLKK